MMDVGQLTGHQAVDQPVIVTVNMIQFHVNVIIRSVSVNVGFQIMCVYTLTYN